MGDEAIREETRHMDETTETREVVQKDETGDAEVDEAAEDE